MQSIQPKVSIILPFFNAGDYLVPAVKSVINQTFPNWELIAIDDGSSDDAVLKLAALGDIRVKIFQDGVNKGLAARLNEAVALAAGQYIARMDHDDLCFPQRIEKQVKFLDDHPDVDLLSTRAVVFNSLTDNIIGMLPHRETHESIVRQPWRGIYMPHPTWMGRSDWFRRFNYKLPDVIRAEDQELLLRAYPDSKYHSIPDVLLAYHQTSYNLRKTLIARKSLFKIQVNMFLGRGQSLYLLKTLAFTGLKLTVDIVAALPGCNKLFFKRMNEPVPENIRNDFLALWTSTRNKHDVL